MKALKIILNIFGVLAAIILSVLTFSFLVAKPFVSTGTALLQPDNLQQIITDMDLSKHLEATLKNSAPDELSELDAGFIDDLVESELVGDILEIYIENFMDVLEDERMEVINRSQIHKLLGKHMPDLLTMVRNSLPQEIPVTDEQIQDYVNSTIEPALVSMVSELPDLEDMGINDTVIDIIQKLYKGTFAKLCLGAIIVFSILIVFVRFPRFKGFLWLGITYLLSALTTALVAKSMGPFIEHRLPDYITDDFDYVVTPIIDHFKQNITSAARSTVIFSIVFIFIFILGRILLSLLKKKESSEETAEQ